MNHKPFTAELMFWMDILKKVLKIAVSVVAFIALWVIVFMAGFRMAHHYYIDMTVNLFLALIWFIVFIALPLVGFIKDTELRVLKAILGDLKKKEAEDDQVSKGRSEQVRKAK